MKTKENNLFKMLKGYITIYLPLQKKVSSNTLKSYKGTLNLFLDYLCQTNKVSLKNKTLEDFSYANINAFLQWIESERNCTATTVNHHLAVIRAFLKYVGIIDPVFNDYYLSARQVAKRKTAK